MRVQRLFTKPNESPFASLRFKRVDVEICHADEAQRVCMTDCEMPADWSYEAIEFLVRHYVRKSGVPAITRRVPEEGVPEWMCRSVADENALATLPAEARYGHEQSIVQVLTRLAGAWVYWGWKHDYFDTESDARAFFDEWCYLMATQAVAPASPQWLNTGLHWAYGIEGDAQGHYHVDAATGKVSLSDSAYHHPQHHHCFIQSVRDELVSDGGIMNLWQREARLFKYGSGTGCNMSSIRGAQEGLSEGTPLGLMRFIEMGDQAVGSIRAGAMPVEKLVVVDADHPEIESFIASPLNQEVAQAAGWVGQHHIGRSLAQLCEAAAQSKTDAPHSWEDGTWMQHSLMRQALADARRAQVPESLVQRALDYLTQGRDDLVLADLACGVGEGASQTDRKQPPSRKAVRVSDALMQSAAHGQAWALHQRTDGSVAKDLAADAVIAQLAQAMWATGIPTVQFADSIDAWHGCKAAGDIRASSPRGEYLFLDDTACDIATLNLLRFVDAQGEWQLASFEHVVRLMVVMLDIAIVMGQYPSRTIAANTYRYRPIGLSYCNLAAALMAMGYAYDSAEARASASAITAIMTGCGYVASAELAREQGAFESFSANRDGMMRLVWQHHEAAFGRHRALMREGVHTSALDHAVLPDARLGDAVHRLWDLAMIRGDEYGYSNAQVSLIATSPNVAKLMDADALATMPQRALVKVAALKDGAKEKRIMPQVVAGMRALGYAPAQIDDVVRHLCGTATLKDAPAIDHDALLSRGFTLRQIAHVEQALGYVRQLRHAFDPFIVGEGFCRDVLRLNDWQMHDAEFDLLSHLGFDAEEVAAAQAYACGTGDIADAPHIREEDWAVFACMKEGGVCVDVRAQLHMMAAIQPFVSGGIAHSLQVPRSSSLTDCAAWLQEAWGMGLKSVHLMRHPQPADARQVVAPVQKKTVFAKAADMASHVTHVPQSSAPNYQRERLPARRSGFTQKVTIEGEPVFLRTGEYADGRLGELFIDLPHQPERVRAFASQFAIAVSVALQHGVPLASLAQSLGDSAFAPSGAVEGTDSLDQARSIVDYVFKELLASYGEGKAQAATTAEAEEGTAQILTMVRG